MNMLVAGVSLWAVVHFIPGLGPSIKQTLVGKIGNGYRGLFALMIILSIILMVMGWQASEPSKVYETLASAPLVSKIIMFVALFLIACAKGQATIRRHIRHPMLMGVGLWAAAHLLSNGDDRSVILFGGLLLWALLEMMIINKREGAWQKPEPAPLSKDIRKLVSTAVLYSALFFAHPYFTGVALYPLG